MSNENKNNAVENNDPEGVLSGSGSGSAMLNDLINKSEESITNIEKRAGKHVEMMKKMEDLQQRSDEAVEIEGKVERNRVMEMLEAEFDTLKADFQKEEGDLAQAVFALNQILENLGAEYKDLQNLHPEDTALIDDANARVKRAEEALVKRKSELTVAQGELGAANTKTSWFWIRKRAVEVADGKIDDINNAIARSKREIENAKQGIEDATKQAHQQARERLLNADMDSSLQEFQFKVVNTIKIIQNRRDNIIAELADVKTRKEISFKVKEEAAKALTQLDEDLTSAEQEFEDEGNHLATLENGTPDHAEQEAKVSEIKTRVENIRGERNTALALHQSKEKFANQLEIHQITLTKQKDNMQIWITSLQSDTEERVVTFKSWLESMKGAADEKAASELDKLGAKVDEAAAEYMVKQQVVSDDLRMTKLEEHEGRLKNMKEAAKAQAIAIHKNRIREDNVLEKWKNEYGINPLDSMFHHHEEEAEAAATE